MHSIGKIRSSLILLVGPARFALAAYRGTEARRTLLSPRDFTDFSVARFNVDTHCLILLHVHRTESLHGAKVEGML